MKLRFSRKTLGIPYAVFLVCFVIIPMLVTASPMPCSSCASSSSPCS